MPRYYFNDQDGECHPDKSGSVLPDVRAARIAAIKTLSKITADHAEEFWKEGEWSMTVTDDTGLTRFQIVTVAHDGAALR